MGQSSSQHSKKQSQKELKRLAKDTHFNIDEIKSLYNTYVRLANTSKKDGVIRKEDLEKAVGSENSVFIDRLFSILDESGNDAVDFREFVWGLAAFSPKASVEEKIEFSFKLYDIDGDNFIKKSELRQLIEAALSDSHDQLSTAEVDSMTNQLFLKYDSDRDGFIGFEDYRKLVMKEPDLLKSFTLSDVSAPVQALYSGMANQWSTSANTNDAPPHTWRRSVSGGGAGGQQFTMQNYLEGVNVGIAADFSKLGSQNELSRNQSTGATFQELNRPIFDYDFAAEREFIAKVSSKS